LFEGKSLETPQNFRENIVGLRIAMKHSDDTPMNKIYRRAPRATYERDRITKEIVHSTNGFGFCFSGFQRFFWALASLKSEKPARNRLRGLDEDI